MRGRIFHLRLILSAMRRNWLVSVIYLGLAGFFGPAYGATSVSEYQLKAAFLYNFTKFVDWPPKAFLVPDAPIVIGIVGDDPFGNEIDDLVRGEVVRDHALIVKRIPPDGDLRSCHVLFISRSEKERLPALLSQLKESPVLTVSDMDRFGEQGGIINLVLENKAVKIEINPTAAERAGLQVSAKLLRLARLVKSPSP
ncbi:MAG TPA: YfiR family protein [Verrucomicrobiae bacterium]|nr:YfiR family protein [Verrucomicrobiae bacterium]